MLRLPDFNWRILSTADFWRRPSVRWTSGLVALGLLLTGALFFWFRPGSGPAPRIELSPGTVTLREDAVRLWCLNETADQPEFASRLQTWPGELNAGLDVVRFGTVQEIAAAMVKPDAPAPPDVLFVDAATAADLSSGGWLARLTMNETETAGFRPEALNFFRDGDTVRALPSDLTFRALFFNRAELAAQGLAEPGPHWNWDTLLAMGRTMYRTGEADNAPVFYGVELPLDAEMWNILAAQEGRPLYAGDRIILGEPDAALSQARALEALLRYFQQYAIFPTHPPEPGVTWFEKGRAALLVAESRMAGPLEKSGLRWGMTCLARGKQRATSLRGYGWAVGARSTQQGRARKIAQKLSEFPAFHGSLSSRNETSVPETQTDATLNALPDAVAEPTLPALRHWQETIAIDLQNEATKVQTTGLLFVEHAASVLHGGPSPTPSP